MRHDFTEEEVENALSNGELFMPFVSTVILNEPGTYLGTYHRGRPLAGGTFTHLKLGGIGYLVTAGHLWGEFLSLRQKNPRVEMRWALKEGEKLRYISDLHPIDWSNGSVDLCIFKSPVDVAQYGARWIEPKEWPPPRPVIGQDVWGIGFPGNLRDLDLLGDSRDLSLGSTTIAAQIASVNEANFTVRTEDLTLFSRTVKRPFLPGGMSGGVFLTGEMQGDYLKITCVGIQSEGGSMFATEGASFSPLRITHTDFILTDGTLDRLRFPF